MSKAANIKAVLATVVAVDGSSYRGPGVRMLVLENSKSVGAISGGCVEKEVVQQSQTVFSNGKPKLMTYDGRFRLGCEGTLYVLLESFDLDLENVNQILKSIQNRESIEIVSSYQLSGDIEYMGSYLSLENGSNISFSKSKYYDSSRFEKDKNILVFKECLSPCFQLIIFGVEHDAITLCKFASQMGWNVIIIASPNSTKDEKDFIGSAKFLKQAPEDLGTGFIDANTAVVIMNHNFSKDLLYLKALRKCSVMYIGVLGAARRKEELVSSLIEYHLDVDIEFLDKIYGPAGLNIGSITPEEISVSIISEILAISRNKKVIHLKDKKGAIHSTESKYVSIK